MVSVRIAPRRSLASIQNIGFNTGLAGPAAWARPYKDMGGLMSFYDSTDSPDGVISDVTGEPVSGNTQFTIPDWSQVYPPGTYDLVWNGGGSIQGSPSPTTVVLSGSGNLTRNCVGAIEDLEFRQQGDPGVYTSTFSSRAPRGTCIRYMESQRINEDGGPGGADYDPNRPHVRKRVVSGANTFWHRILKPGEIARQCQDHGQNLWLCFHHRSTEANINDALDAIVAAGFTGTLYTEWSNEVWNSSFPQYDYANTEAINSGQYGAAPGDASRVQAYQADQAHWLAGLAKAKYANTVGVCASQTAIPNFHNNIQDYNVSGLGNIDAYAVSFYFGGPPARDLTPAAGQALDGQGIADLGRDDWNTRVVPFLNTWKGYADGLGWDLLGYEGGPHYDHADSTTEEHYAALSQSAEVGVLMGDVFDDWDRDYQGVACLFQDVGSPDDPWSFRHGELGPDSPRWGAFIERVS